MHELVLFGQVPQARHEQVLKILAGLAAMQPQRVVERHAVYKPTREPSAPGRQGQVGGTQSVSTDKRTTQAQATKDLYYAQLVQSLSLDDFGDSGKESLKKGSWSLQFRDVPDASKRPASLRMVNITTITDGDAHSFMKALSYNFVKEYVVEGHQYIHENVILFLHRVIVDPEINHLTAPHHTLSQFATFDPLDPSGAYILQASVRLTDNPGPDIIARGQAELLKFQNDIKGVVDLKLVDRLALDARVKSSAVMYR